MTSAKLLTLAIGALFVAISLHFVASGMFLFPFGIVSIYENNTNYSSPISGRSRFRGRRTRVWWKRPDDAHRRVDQDIWRPVPKWRSGREAGCEKCWLQIYRASLKGVPLELMFQFWTWRPSSSQFPIIEFQVCAYPIIISCEMWEASLDSPTLNEYASISPHKPVLRNQHLPNQWQHVLLLVVDHTRRRRRHRRPRILPLLLPLLSVLLPLRLLRSSLLLLLEEARETVVLCVLIQMCMLMSIGNCEIPPIQICV